MKLRTLFILSLLAVLAVMAVPALYGVDRVRDVRRIALDLREQAAQSALAVGRLQAALARLDRYQRSYVATGDPEFGELSRGSILLLSENLDRLAANGYRQAAADIEFPIDSIRTVTEQLELMVEAGEFADATAQLTTTAHPLLLEAEAAAVALAEAIDRETAAKMERADAITAGALGTTTLAFLLAVLIAAVLSFTAARVLTRPLERLSGSMARVAGGRFEPPEDLPYHRHDELGELARSFRSMALRLADLDRMKAEFVGVATHDLKTPVSVISGYAEMLEEELMDSVDPRYREIITALGTQSRTLGGRVNQLLEISRMEAAGLRLGLEEVNVRHFTAGLEKAHAPTAARHGITLTATVDPSTPSFLLADPDCLQVEVLSNILNNAFRFTPSGGRVDLRVFGDGGLITFEVRDTGRPIPAEDLPHIFDRYYKGRGLPGRVGSGLGLPIACAGTHAHGGDIRVDSSLAGTVFRITLPIHPALDPQPDPALQ